MTISIRIYNNGSYTINNVRPEDLITHIEWNKVRRFGCALVVDGKIENEGYLDVDRINEIVSNIDTSRYTEYTSYPYK